MLGQISISKFLPAYSSILGSTMALNQGIYGLVANPSGIARSQNGLSLIVSSEQRHSFAALNASYAGLTFKLNNTDHLGISFGNFGIDEYKEQLFSLNYAKQIGPSSFIGARVNSSRFRIEGYGSTQKLNLDLGFQTRVISQLDVGIFAQNLFPNSFNNNDRDQLSLCVGLQYTPSDKVFLRTESTWSAFYDRVHFGIGLHYRALDKLGFSVGFNTLDSGPSAGLIYQPSDKIEICGGFSNNQTLGVSPTLSFVFKSID